LLGIHSVDALHQISQVLISVVHASSAPNETGPGC
jgi:hypothetical protein